MMYFWPVVKAQAMIFLGVACLAWLLMFSRLFMFRDGEKPGTTSGGLAFSPRWPQSRSVGSPCHGYTISRTARSSSSCCC